MREGELNAVEEVQAWGIAPRLSSSAPGATTSGRSFKAGRFVLRSDLLIPGDIQQGFAAAP